MPSLLLKVFPGVEELQSVQHCGHGSTCLGLGFELLPVCSFSWSKLHDLHCFNNRKGVLELQLLKKLPQWLQVPSI